MELYAYGQTGREILVITWWECAWHEKKLLISEINMARPRNLILQRAVQQHRERGSKLSAGVIHEPQSRN